MSQPLEHLWHGSCPLSNQNTILSKLIHLDIVYQYWSSNLNNNQRHILLLVYYTSLYNIYHILSYNIPFFPSSGSLPQKHLHVFSYKPSSKFRFNSSTTITVVYQTMWHLQGSHQGFHHGHCSVQTLLSQTRFLRSPLWMDGGVFPADWRRFDVLRGT